MTGSVGIDTIDGVRPVELRRIDGVDLCGFNLIEVGKYWGEPRENEDLFRLGSRRSERPGAIDNDARHLSAPHRQSSQWSDDAPRHLGRCGPRSIMRQVDRLPQTLRSARYASHHVRSVLAQGSLHRRNARRLRNTARAMIEQA